jgi:hypothetical protein
VRAHSDQLPTTLAGLSRHSTPYRRAIYAVLPPATREAMWREHMGTYLRPGTTLTEAQQAEVRRVIAQLPALTAAHPDPALARRLLAELSPRFDRPLLKQVFIQLGGPVPEQPVVGSNSRRPVCDCAGTGECALGETCKPLLCTTQTACGVGGGDQCSGVCRT